jgi:hypothetical protein
VLVNCWFSEVLLVKTGKTLVPLLMVCAFAPAATATNAELARSERVMRELRDMDV